MLEKKIPEKAQVVIIGGGISGCSVAYHLGKLGWQDVVLLERKQLTCGTTWHAAGLVGQLRASQNMTRLAKYSVDLYAQLEQETGIATGLRQNGSITIALTKARKQEIYRQATLARAFNVEVEEISAADVKMRYPHVKSDDIVGAVYLPGDGQCDPANITQALARGARQKGVKIFENVKVCAVHDENGTVTGVSWQCGEETGQIKTHHVVNCAGMWGREIAAQNHVNLPLHACEHFYIITEPIANLGQLPVLRVPDECAYYKEDAGKMMLGAFEPLAKPWGMDGIGEDFCFDQLPADFEHFEPILAQAIDRMPILETTGIHTFFNGPESFTPDNRYYLGQAPNLKNYWLAAGYNSVGIVSSGGAGFALAQWMEDGIPPFDLWDVDIRRAQPFQKNRLYLAKRVSETLGLLYSDHFPYRQMTTARGIRRSPLHEHLKAQGSVFGEVAGFERANWFAFEGQERQYHYDWQRQNWFDNQRVEHLSLRENVGLIDMSSFGKIRIEGRDALAFLQHLCAGQIDVEVGRIVYTQMLNERGGIECDLTITRLSETIFLAIVPAATLSRDLAWLHRHKGEDAFVTITDMTAAEAVLVLMGPKSRQVMQKVSPNDFSNEAFPFGYAQEIEIGLSIARAHRVTYVGELGWEIYISTDQAAHIFEILWQAGQEFNLKLCGLHAMDSCRIEKAYRHFGHDITDEDHVLEAGLGFAVKLDKPNFIGRDSVLRKQEMGLKRRLLQFKLNDANAHLFHNEAIVRDGEIVSIVTSANYGHFLRGAIGLGYVPCENETVPQLLASTYEIEIAGERFAATASLKPMYDPASLRTKM